MNHNHANYQRRLDFIHGLLKSNFDVEAAEVTTIAYKDDSPFKFNNFVYRVRVSSPIKAKNTGLQPTCTTTPHTAREFIMRLTNPDAEGMNTANRVENEVALVSLVSSALNHMEPSVVPQVYGWESATGGSQGWILQQLMPGIPVSETFDTMDISDKKILLPQMAHIVCALQKYELPPTITGFGGVAFDDQGQIVSAAMTSVDAGPWPTYQASFEGRIAVALAKADANPYLKGWVANGIRRRLDAFLKEGLASQFVSLSEKERKSIIHADLSPSNILYDVDTKRVTGLIDYDFSCILHPSYEFFRSFDGLGGQFRGWSKNDDNEQLAFRNAKLFGFPSPLPPSTGQDDVDWEVAKAWEDELIKSDGLRPSAIRGIDRVADVDEILGLIKPWRLTNSDVLRLQSEEVILAYREQCEKDLADMLDRLGF